MAEVNFGTLIGELTCGGGGKPASQEAVIPEPYNTWIHELMAKHGIDKTHLYPDLVNGGWIEVIVQPETSTTVWFPGKLEAQYNSRAPIITNGVVVTLDGVPSSPDTNGFTEFHITYGHYATLKVEAPGYYSYERSIYVTPYNDPFSMFKIIALKAKEGTTPPSSTTPPPTTGQHPIIVKVMDAQTHQPVYQAKVVIGNRTQLTNGAGVTTFYFAKDDKGTYTVTATKDNYSGTATLDLASGTDDVAVYLSPSSKQAKQTGFLQTTWGKVAIVGGGLALVYLLQKRK